MHFEPIIIFPLHPPPISVMDKFLPKYRNCHCQSTPGKRLLLAKTTSFHRKVNEVGLGLAESLISKTTDHWRGDMNDCILGGGRQLATLGDANETSDIDPPDFSHSFCRLPTYRFFIEVCDVGTLFRHYSEKSLKNL